ncbi:MAG TPA: MFS transporter, partial [Tepidisphaeraceae bacterium]|nr:MFS transporter [Tepidisphaeraceae bacterium]
MDPSVSKQVPSAAAEAAAPSQLSLLLRAFRYRNYRLFFSGQGISLIGTWLTRIASSWLVYRLTDSAFLLGLVAFAGQAPTLILAPFAGVFVDRWDRHRLLVVTQILAMIQAFALAALTLAQLINIPLIITLSVFQGLINAFDMPARQAFLIEMIENHEDLPNAIALNSSMVNGARLIGPSIAGILIAWVGEGLCFLVDGFSYVAVVAALLAMRVKPRPRVQNRQSHWVELREGVAYAFGFAPIRTVLIVASIVSIMGMSYTVLMPVFATQVLHGGS